MRTTNTRLLAGLLLVAWSTDAAAQRRPRGNGGKKATPAATTERAPVAEPSAEAGGLEPATAGEASATSTGSPTSTPVPDGVGAPDVGEAATTPTAEPVAATVSAPGAEARVDKAAPSALAKDVAGVMDELVQLRARTRVLGKALFKTKVRIRVENEAAPDQTAVRLQLWLDGAPVWSGDGSGLRDPERVLFEGLAAPGPHVLTYEVEQRARDDEKYRYTQRASLRFVALRERNMELVLVLDDDSDMADDFDEDEEGEYDVRVRLQVSAERLDD